MNAATETNVIESTTEINDAANTDLNRIQALIDKPNASIDDFVEIKDAGLYDAEFLTVLEDIAHNVAAKMEPKNYDAEIESLQKELLATKDVAKRFGIMEEITNLMKEQQNQGSDIRNRLAGVPFHEIAVAYAKDIEALVDSVIIEQLKKGFNVVLKHKRGPKTAGKAKTSTASETITFTYDNKEYVAKVGKGPMGKDLKPIAEAYAKESKNPDNAQKANFIEALKAGKVKGAKITETKGTNAAV